MWGGRYWGTWYWGSRYWGGRNVQVVPGYYRASNYWAQRYWPRRYFASQADSNPFLVTQTNTLAGTGSGTVSASFSLTADFAVAQVGDIAGQGSGTVGAQLVYGNDEFSFGAPIEVGMGTGSATFSCTLVFTTTAPGVGRYKSSRYWSPSYWARRYWSPAINFNMAQTNTIAGNGVGLVAGNFATTVGMVQTRMLAASASGSVAGNLVMVEPTLEPPQEESQGGGGKKIRGRSAAHDDATQRAENEARELLEMLMAATAAGVFD